MPPFDFEGLVFIRRIVHSGAQLQWRNQCPALLPDRTCPRPTSAAGMFLNVWPLESGNGERMQHDHPDRAVSDAVDGDIIVSKRVQYRVVQVRPFSWSPIDGLPRNPPWRNTAREAIADAADLADRCRQQAEECHRRATRR